MRYFKKNEAFARAGYTLANKRCHWSALREEPLGVALTVWEDEIEEIEGRKTYGRIAAAKSSSWQTKPGNHVRKKHIRRALDELEGKFDLILCIAADIHEEPRRTIKARPMPEYTGTLKESDYDEYTGSFLMYLVPNA